MKEIKVSVVVPVYNVGKYLEKCLESLVNQTLKEIEIVVVNDGSTDNSQEIIDLYAEKYPDKIKAFSKKNGGLGDARNYGIDKARGTFIGFVDSDDWVDIKMFESMHEMSKEGHDIVMCDMININDGWEKGTVSKSFRGVNFNKEELILNSTNPAISCNKIYHRKFFKLIKFATHIYEDVATTPIFLSYANSVGYLEIPMYYYRQRLGSITNTVDKKSVDVIKSWKRILAHVNPQYIKEAEFAVISSVNAFLDFRAEYADEFLEFTKTKLENIKSNPYYTNAVQEGRIRDLFNFDLIPKKIHYFWFGKGQKSELIRECMKSWKKHAYDYEIIEWNEENCDINENEFVKVAYENKKWAFVADYFRLKIIEEHGGIYLDTDTELTNRIDSLRLNNAFFAFETSSMVHAGIFGAVPKHDLMSKWIKPYRNYKFKSKGKIDTSETIVKKLTKILIKDYNIVLNNRTQVLNDNIKIYSPNVLTINVYDGKSIAQHHYDASWWDVKDEVSYKHEVLKDYFSEPVIVNHCNCNWEIQKYRQLIQDYENTLSWRITSPLRKVRQWQKKILKRA